MTDILAEICAAKRNHIAAQKDKTPLPAMMDAARAAGPVRGFARALMQTKASGKPALITEIKKASPSAGVIRPDFDPALLAKAYEIGGASCLSILTDEPYFQGSNTYLAAAREAAPLPVLRKDFILDPWQIAESRAIGADCVLLIMAALTDADALTLCRAARDWDMDVLLEVHDRDELERARQIPATLFGINNRNLKTLTIDLEVTERLLPHVPASIPVVTESGIKAPADIRRMMRQGVGCFLIGESLMRQTDIAAATRALMDAA